MAMAIGCNHPSRNDDMIFTIVTVRGMITFLVIGCAIHLGLRSLVCLSTNTFCINLRSLPSTTVFQLRISRPFVVASRDTGLAQTFLRSTFTKSMHHENGNQSLFCCPLYNSSSITKKISARIERQFLGAWSQRTQPVPVPGWGRRHRSFFSQCFSGNCFCFSGHLSQWVPFPSTIHEQQSCASPHSATFFTSSCLDSLTCDSSSSPPSCMIVSSYSLVHFVPCPYTI